MMMHSVQPAPPGRIYRGKRNSRVGPAAVVRADPHKPAAELLCPRLGLKRHSPDGFQWGHSGSGPAQLALALVADATGDDRLALSVYQRFKEEIIAPLQEDEWSMAASIVADFARSLAAPNFARSEGE